MPPTRGDPGAGSRNRRATSSGRASSPAAKERSPAEPVRRVARRRPRSSSGDAIDGSEDCPESVAGQSARVSFRRELQPCKPGDMLHLLSLES